MLMGDDRKMRVYRMKADLDEKYYSFLYYINGKYYCKEFSTDMDKGICISNKYTSIDLGIPVEEQMEKGLLVADCSKVWNTAETVVFNQKAKDCLESVFGDYVEYIPAKYQDDIYYIVNVLNVIDALDYEKSVFHTTDDGIPYYVRECSLKQYMVEGISIFKVFLEERIYSTYIFVSQEVKDIVEENGLTGFRFEEICLNNEKEPDLDSTGKTAEGQNKESFVRKLMKKIGI